MARLAAMNPAIKTLDESVARARAAEKLGYESVWTSQLPPARDASLVLAAYAAGTERIKFGTGVLPIYTRHPTAMVQMAATLDEMSGGRFILGIGVSHKVTVEDMWGMRLDKPVDAMREYLTIVTTSLRDGGCSLEGRFFTARWAYAAPRRPEMPVMISALSPRMLVRASDAGQALVEMAIALPVLLLLLIGIVDVSLLVNTNTTVQNASREAATYAITHPTAAASAIASEAALRSAPLHTDLMTVSAKYYNGSTFVPWPVGGIPTSSPAAQVPVAVEISYPWSASTILVGQFIGGGSRTVIARSTMVVTW